MIVSEKSHQNLSDYFQLFLNKRFEFNIKKRLILVKKLEIQVIISMLMLTRSLGRIFNSSRYTGIIYQSINLVYFIIYMYTLYIMD